MFGALLAAVQSGGVTERFTKGAGIDPDVIYVNDPKLAAGINSIDSRSSKWAKDPSQMPDQLRAELLKKVDDIEAQIHATQGYGHEDPLKPYRRIEPAQQEELDEVKRRLQGTPPPTVEQPIPASPAPPPPATPTNPPPPAPPAVPVAATQSHQETPQAVTPPPSPAEQQKRSAPVPPSAPAAMSKGAERFGKAIDAVGLDVPPEVGAIRSSARC